MPWELSIIIILKTFCLTFRQLLKNVRKSCGNVPCIWEHVWHYLNTPHNQKHTCAVLQTRKWKNHSTKITFTKCKRLQILVNIHFEQFVVWSVLRQQIQSSVDQKSKITKQSYTYKKSEHFFKNTSQISNYVYMPH